MNLERLRNCCMGFPGATEQIQWGEDLVFKVGGKMFAVAATNPGAPYKLSFKCSDEGLAELLEQDGMAPAPYLARAKWVALERFDALPDAALKARLHEAYDLVVAKLPKKQRESIGAHRSTARRK